MKIENQNFKNETIILDFKHFVGCTFDECELVYNGYGTVGLDNNRINNCEWTFSGPASNAFQFLSALYNEGGGMANLVDDLFDQIRSHEV